MVIKVRGMAVNKKVAIVIESAPIPLTFIPKTPYRKRWSLSIKCHEEINSRDTHSYECCGNKDHCEV